MSSNIQGVESILGQKIINTIPVSGGDINDTFKIETSDTSFFVKLNNASFANDMFEKEAKGLQLIQESETIPVPNVVAVSTKNQSSFLLLEWVESGIPNPNFWEDFGIKLGSMHQQTAPTFGLDHSNYIGSLVQHNEHESDAISFFITQRLLPQIKLAQSKNRIDNNTISAFEKLFKKLPEILPDEKPALIHGDLWNGNFMVGKSGDVILVDPAAAFGLREMDLAMAKLFGGFDQTFYDSYENAFPTENGLKDRIPIYQLYYLMVHVNIFGGTYLNSVKEILRSC